MEVAVFAFACVFLGAVVVDASVLQSRNRALNVTDLDFYINTEQGRAILEQEYEVTGNHGRKPWTEGEKPENLGKNRYDDLLAYDETRVPLTDGNGSDYINANYIDGFQRTPEYVATQGPLANTSNDFWSMVWQLRAKKIVMLASLFEHGKPKVAKYWPTVSGLYGNIQVMKIAEVEFPKFQHVMRVFLLVKDNTPRIVRHFHFTGWPDLGVPEDPNTVIALMHQVRTYAPEDTAPIVVHCSAGVGRTGTVILMDSMVQKAFRDNWIVDFPRRLEHMRLQRVDVVEKKEQYVFAHRAVHDLFLSNKTAAYLKESEAAYLEADEQIFNMIATLHTAAISRLL